VSRRRLMELGLFAGSIGFALILSEIVIRIWLPSPYAAIRTASPQDTFFEYDPLLGWRGVPDATGPFNGRDFHVHVSNDGNGYRNARPQFVEGKINVLALGDSFGWGWGVENEEIFHARMMERDDRLNVYSMSAPGYSTDQEYLLLEEHLEEHPHRQYAGVVLLFYFNDLLDTASKFMYAYPKPLFTLSPEGDLTLENVPVPKLHRELDPAVFAGEAIVPATWLNGSQLYNLLRFKLPSLWKAAPHGGPGEPTLQERQGLDVTLALLEKISDLCRRRGMFFHIVTLMTRHIDPNAWQWAPMNQFLTDHSIAHSALHSSLLPRMDLWLDGHYTAYGHERLAEHLLSVLPKDGPATEAANP